jgi:hypothetical protein
MLRRLVYGALGLALLAGGAYAAGTMANFNGLLYSIGATPDNSKVPAVVLVDRDGNPSGVSQPYPPGGVQINASSGVVAAGTATATLAASATKNTYITGFQVTALGATAAANVDCTVSGLTGPTTFHYNFSFPAGATVPATPLIVSFPNPLISNAVNTAIVTSCPSGGAGNTYTSVVAQGFQF